MIHCFLSPQAWTGDIVALSPDEAHHALRVRRVRAGDSIRVFDGAGLSAESIVLSAQAGSVHVQLKPETRKLDPPSRPETVLIQALPKHGLMDEIVQKAVELGAAALVPVITERGIVRDEGASNSKKIERWNKIALESAKQTGATRLPVIQAVTTLADWIARLPVKGALWVPTLNSGTRPFREVLAAVKRMPPESIFVVIGPEGDLSEAEVQALQNRGGVPVTFGRNIMRVATAATYALSVIHYELSAT